MPDSERPLNWKLIAAAVLLVGALVFVYAQYRSTQPPDPTEDRRGRDRATAQDRGPQREVSDEERAQRRAERTETQQRRREEMFQQMNLTEEQRTQIEALEPVGRDAEPEARQARRQAMAEILTEEQMTQMREFRRQSGPRAQGEGTGPGRPGRDPDQGPTEQP